MISSGENQISTFAGLRAMSPAILFLAVYLGISLFVGDFYSMPVAVALIVASVWAIIITPGTLAKRISIFSQGAANADVLYMIWIFVLAGAFAALAKQMGAIEASVNLIFSFLPSSMMLPACFFAACFISFSIGTSVGAVVALTPLTVELARAAGAPVDIFVAATLGGAFFGDNLSFISDTTIAATRTQGCRMSDKFRANIVVVLPSALVTLILYTFMGLDFHITPQPTDSAQWWLTLPYLSVIATAVVGVNVMCVLLTGILCALLIGGISHIMLPLQGCTAMGTGIDAMGQLIIITLLAAGMLGIVRTLGGIQWLLNVLTAHIKSSRAAKWSIAFLVSIVNLCTANNTIAILTVGPIARQISERFNLAPRRVASILDSCSCIVQCLIPYGAQCLLASGLSGLPPGEIVKWLFYPIILSAAMIINIIFGSRCNFSPSDTSHI